MLCEHVIKMKKKAQSISLNTIVIAAIALIVLVVIIAIFSGRVQIFNQGARDCTAQGGECKAACEGTEVSLPSTDCEDIQQECCTALFKQKEP